MCRVSCAVLCIPLFVSIVSFLCLLDCCLRFDIILSDVPLSACNGASDLQKLAAHLISVEIFFNVART